MFCIYKTKSIPTTTLHSLIKSGLDHKFYGNCKSTAKGSSKEPYGGFQEPPIKISRSKKGTPNCTYMVNK
jgi:hypothetical protein